MDDKVKAAIERLQEDISDGHYSSWGQKSDIELIITAAEKAEMLAGALRSIAKNTCCDRCQEAALVAQNALKSYEGE